ncbi:MAG: cytochrome c3 family protein [Sulfuricurvum sp.]|jgi:predicted CXXCH cytochrome family protein|uniref:cytochrome c3 family protein n=1 Tax=Sulfuricurvum sp. TaxID=2025608 RepID=UPI0025E63D59|nr:cytochrome c3 family protein [Sulfuricurvum sp.]MCK9373194.1 cytochrome c3 family protein [Sulfuricurvum sp.]
MFTFERVIKSAALIAALSATSAFAVSNITITKHNLSSGGSGTIKSATGDSNNEICVYCHTPHAANTAFSGAPLWNKKSDTAAGAFTMYGRTAANQAGVTIAGTATAQQPNNPSMACLSCHDGASAINSMVNMPGSGGYNAGNQQYAAFGATGAGTAFKMPAGLTQIGTDLSNDHPVSIPYNEGNASLKAVSTTLSGWAGAGTIANLLRGGNVECSSCHDPHEGTNPTFLRTTNAGSALCLGCHGK